MVPYVKQCARLGIPVRLVSGDSATRDVVSDGTALLKWVWARLGQIERGNLRVKLCVYPCMDLHKKLRFILGHGARLEEFTTQIGFEEHLPEMMSQINTIKKEFPVFRSAKPMVLGALVRESRLYSKLGVSEGMDLSTIEGRRDYYDRIRCLSGGVTMRFVLVGPPDCAFEEYVMMVLREQSDQFVY